MLINCESHSKFAPLNPCTLDIFDRIRNDRGPLGQHARETHGYFTFPKLEGEISNRMTFRGKEVLVWSVNNYLGRPITQKPKSRCRCCGRLGYGIPDGRADDVRSNGQHELLESQLADFMQKEDAFLLNYGFKDAWPSKRWLAATTSSFTIRNRTHAW